MALYIIYGSITIDYTQNNTIAAYNRDTPNPYTQYRYTTATVQAPTI